VALARTILTVPINPEFGSLNLAQAVILVRLRMVAHGPRNPVRARMPSLVQPTAEDALPPAPQEELEGLIAHFEKNAGAARYFRPRNPRRSDPPHAARSADQAGLEPS
jgi:tRNA/rRNA methyltransferase